MRSVAAHVWRAAMDRPFVVRATIGNVTNEVVGAYPTYLEALAVAQVYPDAVIKHAVSGEVMP